MKITPLILPVIWKTLTLLKSYSGSKLELPFQKGTHMIFYDEEVQTFFCEFTKPVGS